MPRGRCAEEMVAVVDRHDRVVGSARFKDVHAKGLLHREAYLYLVNSKNRVLLQRRKDTCLWDHSSGGHFSVKEDYRAGALRELKEELGVDAKKKDLMLLGKEYFTKSSHKGINHRFVKVYLLCRDIPLKDFKIDKREVKRVRYFDKKALKRVLSLPENEKRSLKYLVEKYVLKEL